MNLRTFLSIFERLFELKTEEGAKPTFKISYDHIMPCYTKEGLSNLVNFSMSIGHKVRQKSISPDEATFGLLVIVHSMLTSLVFHFILISYVESLR